MAEVGNVMKEGVWNKKWYHVEDKDEENKARPLNAKRLRYIYTEHRWYRNIVLTCVIAAAMWALYNREPAPIGGRFQVDLRTEFGISKPLDPALDDQELTLKIQGCAVSWTPAWFADCQRPTNDRVDGELLDDSALELCTYLQEVSYDAWWEGWYYMPAKPLPFGDDYEYSDIWGEHTRCDYCVGVVYRTKTEFTYEASGNMLYIHPVDQPDNPDTFSAPGYCFVSIPDPAPKRLKIIVDGDQVFKSKVYAANQQPGQNPRHVQVIANNRDAPVLVDMHDVNLASFEMLGDADAISIPVPAPRARLQMTNVSIQRLNVNIVEGYADISTNTDTVVKFPSALTSVCVAGATVGDLGTGDMLLATTAFHGHTNEASMRTGSLSSYTAIDTIAQMDPSNHGAACFTQRGDRPDSCSPSSMNGGVQYFYVQVADGDASVNVWTDISTLPAGSTTGSTTGLPADGKHWFDVFDRPVNGSTSRELVFDVVELESVNAAAADHTIDILNVRASGPGYMAMDTAQVKTFSSWGYVEDWLTSHDLPMRTGPWGFTRRSPLFWHSSYTELAGLSGGTLAAVKLELDLTMKHGFCPTFHKANTNCQKDFASFPTQGSYMQACESDGNDRLLARAQRYNCDANWGNGAYVLMFFFNSAFYCDSPLDRDAPHSLDRHFTVDAKVFSGATRQGLIPAPADPLIMEWGLHWDMHEYGFFRFNKGTRESSIETTSKVKLQASLMMVLLWFGSVFMAVLLFINIRKLFNESVALFKAGMLLKDEQLRNFILKVVPALELAMIDQDEDGVITKLEVEKYASKIRLFKTKDLVSPGFVKQLESFMYTQLLENKDNSEECKPLTNCNLLCGTICNIRRCSKTENSVGEAVVKVRVSVAEGVLEFLPLLGENFGKDVAFDISVTDLYQCLHRLRLLTSYSGLAHMIENVVPNLVPWSPQPDVPESLYFQSTHRWIDELKAIALQVICVCMFPAFKSFTVANMVDASSVYSFKQTNLYGIYFSLIIIATLPITYCYFVMYNFMSTGFNQRGCYGGFFSRLKLEGGIETMTKHTYRKLVLKLRGQYWVTFWFMAILSLMGFFSVVWAVVFVELTMLGTFMYPSRCMPLAATFGGLALNIVSLRAQWLSWYDRIEKQIKEAMETTNEIIASVLEEMKADGDIEVDMDGLNAVRPSSSNIHTTFERRLKQETSKRMTDSDHHMLNKFQRVPVKKEEVSELLRQVGITRAQIVTVILSASVSLLLVCGFLLMALMVSTHGTSQDASTIATFLIGSATAGVNRSNGRRTEEEEEFQALKHKIMKLYWDQRTESKTETFTFDVNGVASTTLAGASEHYDRLKKVDHVSPGSRPSRGRSSFGLPSEIQQQLTPRVDEIREDP
jgi:hypothetical protein